MEEKFVMNKAEKYKKEEVKVEIITPDYRINGRTFKNKKERFSDHLNNSSEDFIALKGPVVRRLDSGEVFIERDYLSINKSHIITTTELS